MHRRKSHVALVLGALVAVTLLATQQASAQVWNNNTGNGQWSDPGNWSTGTVPGTGSTVRFEDLGGPNSVVDALFPHTAGESVIGTLHFNFDAGNPASFSHQVNLLTGRTLRMTNGFHFANGVTDLPDSMDISFTGGAGSTLQVGATNATTATVVLGFRNPGSDSILTQVNVDLSGLENFNAFVNTFNVASTNRPMQSVLKLAQNNYIRGNTLTLSNAVGNNLGTSEIHLGENNTLHMNLIEIGRHKSRGTMEFQTGLVDPQLTIRGLDGSSRADLYVGYNPGATGARSYGILDVSAGTIDARIDDFMIGWGPSNATSQGANGTFTMSAGLLDATNIVIGRSDAVNTSNGFFNLNGGQVVADTILLAERTSTGPATGEFNLAGGSVQATTISRGTGTASFNFDGGSLAVENFNFDLTQNGGTLRVNTDTPTTIVGDYVQNAGILSVNLTDTLGPALVINGVGDFSGALEVVVPGNFVIPTEPIEIISGDLLVSEFTEFFSSFPGMSFELLNTGTSIFVSNFNVVPEPSTFVLLGLGCCGLAAAAYRRRSRKAAEGCA